MTIRRVLCAFALPLALLACEEKGIPSPAADTAKATDTSKPTEAQPATPSDTVKPADGDKPADTEAKADPTEEPKDGEEKPEEKPGSNTKTADGDKPKPAPGEPEPEPTTGEKKSEGSYSAWLQSSGKYKVDQPGAVVAVVNAAGEFKCNDKYPYKFTVSGTPEGVSFGSTTVRGASISPKSTSLRIPFTPTSKGAKTISGTFFFSVCNAETCHIKKQPMSVTVNVE